MSKKQNNNQAGIDVNGRSGKGSGALGNSGNAGHAKGFDEQHGIRGSQLNANTTANTGKSKHRGE